MATIYLAICRSALRAGNQKAYSKDYKNKKGNLRPFHIRLPYTKGGFPLDRDVFAFRDTIQTPKHTNPYPNILYIEEKAIMNRQLLVMNRHLHYVL